MSDIRCGHRFACLAIALSSLCATACTSRALAVDLPWTVPGDRYRVILTVNPSTLPRSHAPTGPVRLDFGQLLSSAGGTGVFDEHTIEIVGYDNEGTPHVYDASRSGYEQYLLPWRLDKYYGIDAVDLTFVMPDPAHRTYAVHFDTVASGNARPDRYPGIVGSGDWFVQGYGRREIGPSKFGDMADFDGDGDLDLFEGGVEPFIYCYENLHNQVGEHRFVERGRMTSGGNLFMPSRNLGSNRAWMTVTLYDWDGDGDQDLFPTFTDGPDIGHIVYFRNTTSPGGQLAFSRIGQMTTVGGSPLGGGGSAGWFPTPTFVKDWDGDGDGRTDVIVAKGENLYLHRNLGPGGAFGYLLDNGVKLQADGQDIHHTTPRADVADIDADGDLDLVTTSHGDVEWFNYTVVYLYKNVGSRTAPVFAAPVVLATLRHFYGGLKIADFHGNDGRPDIAVGTFWHVNADGDQPKSFGGLLKNVGPADNPAFEVVLADGGAPYTEQFQICDAGQQNGVRSVNWDGDGDHDLVAATTDGYALYFKNLTGNLAPVFAPVQTLMLSGGGPVRVSGPEGGYARNDIADWNNDGFKDLIIADEEARVWVFLNDGQSQDPPAFLAGTQVYANGLPIDGNGRGSVTVCDWNNDGRKDLVMGMAPKANVSSPYLDWPFQDGDNNKADDEGFLLYLNTGTDAAPVLAYPSWIRAGGKIITYTRPNLGAFVDWDGNGVKDFIGCHFEGNVRLYVNTGSGAPGVNPQLTPTNGIILVEPFVTTQMISGADALDWRGDGDIDLLTGQGHGGAGLRFYERDAVNDFVNGTAPSVTVGAFVESRSVRADADGDGDVDQADYGFLQACFSGSGHLWPTGCARADLDSDFDVDGDDVGVFLACMTGTGVIAEQTCAN